MAKKFDLAEYVKDNMSKMDTGMEQITLLPLEKLIPDERNFYSLDGIDELAANIETVGLLDPIRVRPQDGEYVIVSGHRRRAACLLIRDGGNPMFDRGVPCIIELGEASDAMRELRLIFANSATRQLTSAELSKQAERTNAVLLQLKKEGFEFKGKTRELVAEILHVSESKVARVSAIRKNLCDSYRLLFDAQRLPEGLAYRISQESQEVQKELFEKLGTAVCSLTGEQLDKVIEQVRKPKAEPETVSPMRSSFDAEAYLAERAEEDDAFFEMLSAEADPFLRQLGAVNSRQEGIAGLKLTHGSSHHGWCTDWVDVNCTPKGVRLWDIDHKRGGEDITRTWTDVYDMLCTIALNRAAINIGAEPEDEEDESPTGCAGAPFRQGGQVSPEPEWMTGTPPRIGRYFCKVDMGDSKPHENRCWWGDDGWSCYGTNLKANGWKVVGWWPLPKERLVRTTMGDWEEETEE